MIFGNFVSVWNNLNAKYQGVEGAESMYSAALNVVPEKIEGVWTMSQQYLDHESKTFVDLSEARSGMIDATELFQSLVESGADPSEIIQGAQGVFAQILEFQTAANLAVDVQIEAYPSLRGADTTEQAMNTLEEGVNEVKTALDDWIVTIRNYNTYRGSFWPNIYGSFMGRFPSEIEYYKGSIEELDISSLNPAEN
ncbi:LemA family protein [Patescibacteria group bacterium]